MVSFSKTRFCIDWTKDPFFPLIHLVDTLWSISQTFLHNAVFVVSRHRMHVKAFEIGSYSGKHWDSGQSSHGLMFLQLKI